MIKRLGKRCRPLGKNKPKAEASEDEEEESDQISSHSVEEKIHSKAPLSNELPPKQSQKATEHLFYSTDDGYVFDVSYVQ